MHSLHSLSLRPDLCSLEVSCRVRDGVCKLLIDGEPISLELLKDPDHLRLPVSPSMRFCIGWSPMAESPSCLLLHEMRLWSVSLSASAVQRSVIGPALCSYDIGIHQSLWLDR
jgi:hypothetical protein